MFNNIMYLFIDRFTNRDKDYIRENLTNKGYTVISIDTLSDSNYSYGVWVQLNN